MNKTPDFKLFEKNSASTDSYDPPKYLVSPALDPETQEPNDKLVKYMEDEAKKRTSYFKPGIRSASPPKNVTEVDHTLDRDK